MERKVIGVFVPNLYAATSIENRLDWNLDADFYKAPTLEDADNLIKEKKFDLIIVDTALCDEKDDNKIDLVKHFSKQKLILLTSLDKFADVQGNMANVIEVMQKPADLVTLDNLIKKTLWPKKYVK